ncbi:urease accessory protein UreE [uncultured Phenylobacterium sp.]|uniref:urease accessory protein UreE n=1 Tax=uncultured Phenylobacterium sp. TaxID=349273 RepID=UPI0025D2E6A0|nr:urease accessory protein UreE [uncultured Phenylobacterium sp.]
MTPHRVIEVLDPGQWRGHAADHICLDYDDRHRRRLVLTAEHGTRFMLDFPESRRLAGGSALRLEDGRLVEVTAREEALLEVRATDAPALLRLAWHIGNRHLAAQVEADRILIRRDHVIAEMLAGLGATVRELDAPFDPEGGAYGGAHIPHGHHPGHGHAHGH